jgi:hypothetical protein
MTDFLTRLATRIVSSGGGLVPNAPSRFAPTPGLDGDAGLFEVTEEREVHAPARPSTPPSLRTAEPVDPVPRPETKTEVVPQRGAHGIPEAPAEPQRTALSPRSPEPTQPTSAYRATPTQREPVSPARGRDERSPAASDAENSAALETRLVAERTVEHHHDHVVERVFVPAASSTAAAPPLATQPTLERPGAAARSDPAPRPRTEHSRPASAPPPPAAPRAPQPAPFAPPPRSAARTRPVEPDPVQPAPVTIRIDRLEVRVTSPRPAPAPAARPGPQQPTAPDLERYLSNSEGRRK